MSARMTRPFRSLVALALALLMGVTSLGFAAARGQARIAGEIVICTGMGVTVVAVDAQGNPVGTPHICPDMALALLAAPPLAPLVLLPPAGSARAADLPEPAAAQGRAAPRPAARGPPAPA